MAKFTSKFFSYAVFEERNRILLEELEEDGLEDMDADIRKELRERYNRGPVPCVYDNGSFKETLVINTFSNPLHVKSYDEMRRTSTAQWQIDMWNECEAIDEEDIDIREYSVVNRFRNLKEEPVRQFEDINLDDISNLLDDTVVFPEKVEVVREIVELDTVYDIILLHFYLYSSGAVKKKLLELEDIYDSVRDYYIVNGGKEIVLKENISMVSVKIKEIVAASLSNYYKGVGMDVRRLGLLPHALFFVSTSSEKYNEMFDIFMKTQFFLVRVPVSIPELQGNFISVVINKGLYMEDKLSIFFVEDTSLGLEDLKYSCGTYVKEFFTEGGLSFFSKFLGNKTLWICSCFARDSKGNYYLSISGTVGSIGPPGAKVTYSFNCVNYVGGVCVADDEEHWEDYHPRYHCVKNLSLMLSRRGGGVGVRKAKFKHPASGYYYDIYVSSKMMGTDVDARLFFKNIISTELKWD